MPGPDEAPAPDSIDNAADQTQIEASEFEAEFHKLNETEAAPQGTAEAPEAPEDRTPADEQPATPPGVPAAEATPPDPWAGASPELIAERDRILAEHQLEKRRLSGTQSALQRRLDELTKAPPKDETTAAAKRDDEIDDLEEQLKAAEEDYPDAVRAIIAKQRRLEARLNALAPVVENVSQEREVADLDRRYTALHEAHSDFTDFMQDGKQRADFDAWLTGRSKAVAAMANSDDPAEISEALQLYKASKGAATQPPANPQSGAADTKPQGSRRQAQLEANREVGSKPAPSLAGPPADYEGSWDYYNSPEYLKSQGIG